MATPQIAELTEVLNFLVDRDDYQQLRCEVAALANLRHGYFTGDLVPLNQLVDYARELGGAEHLEPLWRLTDEALGVRPDADRRAESRRRKADYQLSYVRAQRTRDRKAVMLKWRLLSPQLRATTPNGLIGQARRDFIKHINAVWQARKTELLKDTVYATERNALTQQFWETVERQLDAGLAGDFDAARDVLGESERQH